MNVSDVRQFLRIAKPVVHESPREELSVVEEVEMSDMSAGLSGSAVSQLAQQRLRPPRYTDDVHKDSSPKSPRDRPRSPGCLKDMSDPQDFGRSRTNSCPVLAT